MLNAMQRHDMVPDVISYSALFPLWHPWEWQAQWWSCDVVPVQLLMSPVLPLLMLLVLLCSADHNTPPAVCQQVTRRKYRQGAGFTGDVGAERATTSMKYRSKLSPKATTTMFNMFYIFSVILSFVLVKFVHNINHIYVYVPIINLFSIPYYLTTIHF